MSNNGHRPQDKEGTEGKQEGAQGPYLQQSPSATDGGDDGKEGNPVLVHIENASEKRSLLIQANTPEEVKAGIFRAFPSLNCPQLYLEVFSSPYGSKERKPLAGPLLNKQEVYATLYLTKH